MRARFPAGGGLALAFVSLLVLGAVGLAAAVMLLRDPGTDDSAPRPLRARATLSDRIVAFGDTVHARVDVALDLRRIDPGAVTVQVGFAPWRRVSPVQVVRTDAGSSSLTRLTYVLRCLKPICVPERETRPFDFAPARIEFVNRAGGRGALRAPFPRLTMHTRVAAGDLATAAPWRLDTTSVPQPSFRGSPDLIAGLLAAGSVLLLGCGGGLAYVGRPRRRIRSEPAAEPEPELLPTPLEQALELLEAAARGNGAADQRRSLELVAEVLGGRGEEDELARSARALAWSPTAPRLEDTKALASRVRAALDEELRRLEAERVRAEQERWRRAEEDRARKA